MIVATLEITLQAASDAELVQKVLDVQKELTLGIQEIRQGEPLPPELEQVDPRSLSLHFHRQTQKKGDLYESFLQGFLHGCLLPPRPKVEGFEPLPSTTETSPVDSSEPQKEPLP